MGSKLDWSHKTKIWESRYLKNMPIDRIRTASDAPKSGEVPSWDTVRRVVEEFPSLTEAQVHQLSDALQARWREVRSQVEQERPTEPPTESQSYKAHEKTMRALAGELAARIELPSLFNRELWDSLPLEFQPGKSCLSIGAVEVDEDGEIRVRYCDVDDYSATPRVLKGLYDHLESSGFSRFSELMGDKGEIASWVAAVGQYSEALMAFLKIVTDTIRGAAKVNLHDEVKLGLTRWFIITVWIDAIQQAGDHTWIHNSWYRPPSKIPDTRLWKQDCGAYRIAIRRDEESLTHLLRLHKELRHRCASHPLARSAAIKGREIDNTSEGIRQRLYEFRDMASLPGHCEICRPSSEQTSEHGPT